MRRAVTIALHVLVLCLLTALASAVFLHTADDDTWYPRPHDADPGDDDGYLVAVLSLLPYVIPLLAVAYVAGALVSRARLSPTDDTDR
ncbi:hypothetical protein [Nocardioides dongkuii]|uniref:hypothetical protein n=1 Tax=Nocardioides dongkuii TaxID=2760089 RepID=UPI0015F7EDBE|nr:hypothetical protein [Nocardioides dongkuii]